MASDERRKYDQKIEELVELVKDVHRVQAENSIKINEVHQRQNEVTIPAIAEMKETLYSRGGLCETIHSHSGEIKEINNRIDKASTIIGWILGGVSIGAGVFLWIYETILKVSNGGAK